MQSKRHPSSAIDSICNEMDQLPEFEDVELTTPKAVRKMAPRIMALREKKYSWTRIAEWLRERGVDVTPEWLCAFVTRIAREAADGHPVRRRPVATTKPAPKPAARPQPTVSSPQASAQPAAMREADAPRAAARPPQRGDQQPETPPAAVDESAVPPWSFVVRPDTPDL